VCKMSDYIKGFESLMSQFESAPDLLIDGLEKGVDQSIRRIKRDAKKRCGGFKNSTGRLRNSISSRVGSTFGVVQGTVYTNVEYAPYVEFGTGQRGRESNIPRPEGISYSVDWKGMKAMPFLYPALLENEDQIKDYIEQALITALKEVVR
jgi:HK97 gp10 family phage protein